MSTECTAKRVFILRKIARGLLLMGTLALISDVFREESIVLSYIGWVKTGCDA